MNETSSEYSLSRISAAIATIPVVELSDPKREVLIASYVTWDTAGNQCVVQQTYEVSRW